MLSMISSRVTCTADLSVNDDQVVGPAGLPQSCLQSLVLHISELHSSEHVADQGIEPLPVSKRQLRESVQPQYLDHHPHLHLR